MWLKLIYVGRLWNLKCMKNFPKFTVLKSNEVLMQYEYNVWMADHSVVKHFASSFFMTEVIYSSTNLLIYEIIYMIRIKVLLLRWVLIFYFPWALWFQHREILLRKQNPLRNRSHSKCVQLSNKYMQTLLLGPTSYIKSYIT